MKFFNANGLAATYVLTLASLTQAQRWQCQVREDGPGSERVAEAVGYYENAFGAGNNGIPSLTSRAVRFNGLDFAVVNSAGYDQEDLAQSRGDLVLESGEIGSGDGCHWDIDGRNAFDIGYFFSSMERGGTDDCNILCHSIQSPAFSNISA